ncbi:hypothetical protein, partial [Streptosporangium lutulentum]|uniref:hypothetical protein n=1 Tax=Streptosporangium lutulentum TaxID=1461250 RepID=UPI0036402677
MPAYREHAIAIAAAVNADGAARVHPDPPQTPIFHIHLPALRRAVEQAGAAMFAEHDIQLYGREHAMSPIRINCDTRRLRNTADSGRRASDMRRCKSSRPASGNVYFGRLGDRARRRPETGLGPKMWTPAVMRRAGPY